MTETPSSLRNPLRAPDGDDSGNRRGFRFASLGRALAMAATCVSLGAVPSLGAGCATQPGQAVNLDGQRVRLRLIHTSDIHSRLFPYEYTPLTPDKAAGLLDGKGPYGGIARMAYVINSLRNTADRSLHINGGDVFEGAPIFNYFSGEAEVKALAATGVDAMVIANHEFDRGAQNIFVQFSQWADFPVLAANYMVDDTNFPGNQDLGALFKPFTILNVKGLRVAVIGMGNLSTITSIFEQPNRYGLLPYSTREIAQFYVDLVRPQSDIVVVVTHLGLDVDQQMIAQTEGIDVVLGGHNHIVVSPPQEVYDCGGDGTKDIGYVTVPSGNTGDTPLQRPCHPRKVLLMHSGAFAKFVGQLDLDVTNDPSAVEDANGKTGFKDANGNRWYDPVNGFEVVSHSQNVIPIDRDVPEDRNLVAVLEPYKRQLAAIGNLDLLVGYAPAIINRTAPAGGDSQLGNLIATSMLLRLGVQTDFSITNTTGIRSDMPQGAVTIEQMFNVFPFDNTITKMQVSGQELFELFDFVARRSQSRACVSQIQIAGSFIAINCQACDIANYRADRTDAVSACAEQVFIGYEQGSHCSKNSDCVPGSSESDPKVRFACDITNGVCRTPMDRNGSYELATSNYLAGGGSGFRVLQRNTTQFDTKINMRDAVIDYVRYSKPCGWQKGSADGSVPAGVPSCSTDTDCAKYGDFVCSCYDNVGLDTSGASITCPSTGATCTSGGQCVLRNCRNDLASFHDDRDCAGLIGDTRLSCRQTVCKQSGEQCKLLACIDGSIGAAVDARQVMLGR